MESGRIAATHVFVFLEKRYGVFGSRRERHVNFYSHIERKTHFTRENTRNLGAPVRHAFSLKNTRNWRGWSSVTYKFTVKMKHRRNLIYGMHNDFSGVGGGLRKGCILIRSRDGGVL